MSVHCLWIQECIWHKSIEEKHHLKTLTLCKGTRGVKKEKDRESNSERCMKNTFFFSSAITALEPDGKPEMASLTPALLTYNTQPCYCGLKGYCTRIYTNWKYIFVFVICFISGLRRWTDPATNHTLASLHEQTLMPGLSGDSSDACHLLPNPVLACVRLSYLLHFRTGGVCCGLESFQGWRPFPIAPLAFLWNGSLSSLALFLI